jgi:RHS repeat-associated protein
LYTWREYDAELKLYYNRARYYSPDLWRFISRDPIDIADDINLYAYVGNNSVMFVDRNGLTKNSILSREERFWELHNYIVWNDIYQNSLNSGNYLNSIDLIFLESKRLSENNSLDTLRIFWDVLIYEFLQPIDTGEISSDNRRNNLPDQITSTVIWNDKLQHFAFYALWEYINKDLNDNNLLYSEITIDIFMQIISYWFEWASWVAWLFGSDLVYDVNDINANNLIKTESKKKIRENISYFPIYKKEKIIYFEKNMIIN